MGCHSALWRAGLSAMLLAGCWSSSTDGADTEAGEEPDADEGLLDDAGGRDDACYCTVDFPCRYSSVCVSERSLRECETLDCEFVCGCTPCSGAVCSFPGSGPPVTCPDGTVCLERGSSAGGYVEARCLPPPPGSDAYDGTDAADVDYDGWSGTTTLYCH